ncbi:hypothetical protein NQ317_007782 [Molorchus minor]|uniref:Odorant receptor n=1 Tax=Molorchus minor TaxID=1323400 RepID=A0ABQ9JXX0_9CUCU|nr:hypothetical protein NQ317_007782 [Molorchus minor]
MNSSRFLDKTGAQITFDISIIISITGTYYFNVSYVANLKKIATVLKDLSNWEIVGMPSGTIEFNIKLNKFSRWHQFYISFAVAGLTMSQLLDMRECKKINAQMGIKDVCGLATNIWTPFDVDYFPVKQIIYLIQLHSAYYSYAASSTISFSILESMKHIIFRMRHVTDLFVDAFNEENYEKRKAALGRCIDYHNFIIRFQDAVYSTNWYNLELEIQKDLILVLLRNNRPIYLKAGPFAHTGSDIGVDLAIIISVAGSYYFNFAYMKNVKKIADVVQDLFESDKQRRPPGLAEFSKKMDKYSIYHQIYIILCTMTLCALQLLDIGRCREENAKLGLHDICGLVANIWVPFDADFFPVKQIIYVIQIYSTYFSYATSSTISFSIMESIEHAIFRLQYVRTLFVEALREEACDVRMELLGRCVDYHNCIISFWIIEELDGITQQTWHRVKKKDPAPYTNVVDGELSNLSGVFENPHAMDAFL